MPTQQDIKDLSYYLMNRKKDIEMLTICQFKRYTSGKDVYKMLCNLHGSDKIRDVFLYALGNCKDKIIVWDYFNFVRVNDIAEKNNVDRKTVTRRISKFTKIFIERLSDVRALHKKN